LPSGTELAIQLEQVVSVPLASAEAS
jgi:hypothetical protein